MSSLITKTAAADALVVLTRVALTAFIVATLYVARDILIPLALAALLTFLLAPLVTRLERLLGRVVAVLLVVMVIFAMMGAAGWVLTRQVIDLAAKLPDYKVNIVTKLRTLQMPTGGAFSAFSKTVEELKKELPGSPAEERVQTVAPVADGAVAPLPSAAASPPIAPPAPAQKVAPSLANPIDLMRSMIAPLLGPLGTAALVLLLVIFMLLQREDLRNRLIRLVGQGRISATTRAMDDASRRVSRYLLMQLVVNVTYGIPVAIGLYFIGVPNAILWGCCATVLRFIPYLGPWIAAVIPVALSLAVSPSWMMPMLTIGLFVVLELLSNNVMEPWLYGSSTGVSPIALIIAAVFWTWLWGPVGLVLATPLTVCLVVMGRHVTRLSFLDVLLSDEEALTPAEDCYHRLLTPGERDEWELVEAYLKANSLTALYDFVLIPTLTAAETDARTERLDPQHLIQVKQSMRDIIEDLGTRPFPPAKVPPVDKTQAAAKEDIAAPMIVPDCRVFVLPARADRDELAGIMLMQLLRQQGIGTQNAPAQLVAGEMLALVEKADVDVICISVVPPSTVIHARYLCLKLRALLPDQKIVIGLWGATEEITEATKRLRDSGADEVVTTLADALAQIPKLAPILSGEMMPTRIPEDEEERLATLAGMNLLDTDTDPFFDRITARLTRVFEVPIALISLVDRDRQFFKSQIGLPESLAKARQTPRNISICGHVIAKNEVMVVEDLARDRRFANNPLVQEHGIRFYAGAPLLAPNGQPIGSLCLMAMKPHRLSERDKRLLQEYATDVMEEIAKRAPQPAG